jgi:hypothetical protein
VLGLVIGRESVPHRLAQGRLSRTGEVGQSEGMAGEVPHQGLEFGQAGQDEPQGESLRGRHRNSDGLRLRLLQARISWIGSTGSTPTSF